MKKIFIAIALFTSLESVAQTKTEKLNLKAIELAASIEAPLGSKVLIEKWSNSINVAGFSSAVVVEEIFGSTIDSYKKEVKSNTVNVLSKFIVEDANGYIYESSVMPSKKEYHFDFVFTIGDKAFHFYDNRPSAFTEAQVKQLYGIIKTIKAN
jgi:hypothetical protein